MQFADDGKYDDAIKAYDEAIRIDPNAIQSCMLVPSLSSFLRAYKEKKSGIACQNVAGYMFLPYPKR